ncbi:RING/U-box superfamily protein [Striga asiatica]|uniref:RING/U-box superfamily protein n=1 Tax=Striga asiatica TaxID=4170 RepID=A0A5A7PL56_STRAF|nr:RING/U-box superfamily protein [Striga asiatica]
MGGCCCCASKGTEPNSSPTFFHSQYPASEEREPLSAHHALVSTQPTGLLVDTNLDTTVPDTYHPPPAPIPYESYAAHPPTSTRNRESTCNKTDNVLPANNTEYVGDVNSGSNLEVKVKDIECDEKSSANIELGALEDEISDDLKKSIEPMVPSLQEEEDVCPTCLEGTLELG